MIVLLDEDACEVYKWMGERMLCPESLVGYSFIIKGKVGRGKLLCLFPLSAPPPGWEGEFFCPYVVRLGPQMVLCVCIKRILRILDSLSWLGLLQVSCRHCVIVWGRVPCFRCMVLLLSLLGLGVKQTYSLEWSLTYRVSPICFLLTVW